MLRRFLLLWAVDAVSLVITAALLPGMAILSVAGRPASGVGACAALLLGLFNAISGRLSCWWRAPLAWSPS